MVAAAGASTRENPSSVSPMTCSGGAELIRWVSSGGSRGSMQFSRVSSGGAGLVGPPGTVNRVAELVGLADGVAVLVGLSAVVCAAASVLRHLGSDCYFSKHKKICIV